MDFCRNITMGTIWEHSITEQNPFSLQKNLMGTCWVHNTGLRVWAGKLDFITHVSCNEKGSYLLLQERSLNHRSEKGLIFRICKDFYNCKGNSVVREDRSFCQGLCYGRGNQKAAASGHFQGDGRGQGPWWWSLDSLWVSALRELHTQRQPGQEFPVCPVVKTPPAI